jgi:hypothetical protein
MLCGLFLAVASFKLGVVVDRRPDCLRKELRLRTQMPSFSHSGPAARNGIFECRYRAPKKRR